MSMVQNGQHPVRRGVLIALAFLVMVILLTVFIWPTPFAYEEVMVGSAAYNVRIHRFTGRMEMRRTWGWEKIDFPGDDALALTSVDTGALEVTRGYPRIEWGSLQYEITNRSRHTVWEITADLTVTNADGTTAFTREYHLQNAVGSVRCDPGTTALFYARLGFHLKEGQNWKVYMTGARGSR
jgi:hypothetical protein